MNQTIKDRIAKINSGQVPEGYEKTSFGIFPCDWEKAKLSDIAEFCGGGTPSTKIAKYWEGDIPWISSSDISEGDLFNVQMTRYITKEAIGNSATKLCPKGSIAVVTRVGVGKLAYIDCDYCTSQDFSNIIKCSIKKEYLLYKLHSAIQKYVEKAQGTSIKGITTKELLEIVISYPKTEREQSRIAQILMQWDKTIELQEKYIASLKKRKKALMQRLLTPKEGWGKVNLKDVCKIVTGKLDVNAMCINGQYPFFTCSKQVYKIDKYAFDCEALLIAGNGDIGDIKYYKGKFNAYQRTYVLYDFSIDIKYVMYFLEKNFDKSILKGTQKSSMPFIKLELLHNAEIYICDDFSKVVNILSQADQEITLQKQKLQKLIAQRKALMQVLLTGIVRV